MEANELLRQRMPAAKACAVLIGLLAGLPSARGQNYEITSMVGGQFGGTVKIEQALLPDFKAHLADSVSFGVAGGYRFDSSPENGDHDLIEFRWWRQDTHLTVMQNLLSLVPPNVAPFRPPVTLDYFLGDFTHQFALHDAPRVEPFITVSLGANHMSAPASGATRFAFAIGAGVSVFPTKHWGFRFNAEYLPTVMDTQLQRLVCAASCLVILNGGIMNQFDIAIGPAFRF